MEPTDGEGRDRAHARLLAQLLALLLAVPLGVSAKGMRARLAVRPEGEAAVGPDGGAALLGMAARLRTIVLDEADALVRMGR